MIKLRDYQQKIVDDGTEILLKLRLLYLSMEVRTGKTLTSLSIAKEIGAKSVLFITKKKALSSVEDDYYNLLPPYMIDIKNWGSEHKATGKYDLMIIDEAHGLGAFPKPSGRVKKIREIYERSNFPKVIFLSGTPTPESFSQIFHQVHFALGNPFGKYANFYKFAKDYVTVRQFKVGGLPRNDYSNCSDRAIENMKPYTISYTQRDAGFKNTIIENVLECEMTPEIYDLVKRIKRDRVVEIGEKVILAETGAKLMSKVHQLCSGTVKYEDGSNEVLDTSKATFIRNRFAGQKIGIFYKFTAELDAIKEIWGDNVTSDIAEFNSTKKDIALQIVSGREGISLRHAESLVYYNIDFSANSYWQSRDRMTTIDRVESNVYWIFSRGGIEKKIYNSVIDKKDYNLRHFKKDFEILN